MAMLQQNCWSACRFHNPFLPQVQGEHIGAAAGQCEFKAPASSFLTAQHGGNGPYLISLWPAPTPNQAFSLGPGVPPVGPSKLGYFTMKAF